MSAVNPVRPEVRRRPRRRRARLVTAGLLALLLAASLATLSLGDLQVSALDVLRTLAGHGTSLTDYLVDERSPRLVAGLVAGAALGLSGALFQTVLRNELASPDILGVTGGASVATVIATVVLGWSGPSAAGLAFCGAVLTAGLIRLLAGGGDRIGDRFVLVGIGVSFMVNATLGYVLTRSDISQAQVALAALVGGIGNADWPTVLTGLAGLVVLAALVLPATRVLRVLQLGDDTAAGLGVRTGRARAALLAAAVVLAAVGVGVAGPLAFVAFVAPPTARRLVGGGSPALFASALTGALVVLAADLAAQHLVPTYQTLPAGVLTGAVGAPYLLWLLTRAKQTR